MKKRQKQGLGCNPKKADVVTFEMENFLFENNFFGSNSPKQLLNTLIYLLGVRLMLRSSEHRQLRLSMFEIGDDFFVYNEWSSKNNPGGLLRKNLKPKSVKVVSCEDKNRCPVQFLKMYVQFIRDKKMDVLSKAFYFRSTVNGFSDVPVGENTLQDYLKDTLKKAGYLGYYTLHGLRRTGITRLFNAYVPEHIIKTQSGHSSAAVREYETISTSHEKMVSDVISGIRPEVASSSGLPVKCQPNPSTAEAAEAVLQVPKKKRRKVHVSVTFSDSD